ncbi:MAG: acyl carrier protein [Zetaproteobacteria bacterium CG12_big_fil_rev_8_21_14_0_65_55_1124]|nr:MAG: acyl carrier protein [Zetaproteobacteria bacterium CG08_land_8_20_14_0_20_55_17]PIW42252.1 MAG: acyl carrier protein [Zetaproteobacteria bacterium CG12_big_fil_rev_8_21_14_0_65_55_1124]PIY51377.1 MAG: acyl carrier protein [Zetaproteobacteria bacterium CG_4_10_14_0_8_um_filter_55_43]PIZ38660.1 MAG: acyl carrier protein [Zetaproteobacteria bacterium CG_4_10_14_0_2_um_filter_55_20]PJB81394.1 MAG: acyl carrier protein [Zetaproteobacteria bacterium CG_4_9_14_0_8_um_filter_55_31]
MRNQRAACWRGTMLDELRELIINELNLEDVSPEDIKDDEPLFGGGLGLDSIDALELAIVVERKYGVKIKSGDDRNVQIFSSLAALAKHIEENRTR